MPTNSALARSGMPFQLGSPFPLEYGSTTRIVANPAQLAIHRHLPLMGHITRRDPILEGANAGIPSKEIWLLNHSSNLRGLEKAN